MANPRNSVFVLNIPEQSTTVRQQTLASAEERKLGTTFSRGNKDFAKSTLRVSLFCASPHDVVLRRCWTGANPGVRIA